MTLPGLYLLFAKIGFFTIGGGYAMIPLYQVELVNRLKLLTTAEFADMVALAQMTPGPVGLNAATYVGQNLYGFWGACAATAGVVTPSLLLGILAAAFLTHFRHNRWMELCLKGIRPAIVGLVASAVLFFAEASVVTGSFSALWKPGAGAPPRIVPAGLFIFLLTIVLSLCFRRLKLVYILLIAILVAAVL